MNKYGILLEKISIDDDLYMYKPIDKVNGELFEYMEDCYMFRTSEAIAYYLASDLASLDSSNNLVVSDILTEEELKEKYYTNDINEALEEFAEDFIDQIYFGLVSYDDEKIVLRKKDSSELVFNIFQNKAVEYNSNNTYIDYDVDDVIYDDYMSSNYLKESFDNAINSIKKEDDYIALIDLLESVELVYQELSTRFKNEEPKALENICLKLAFKFKSISKFENIEDIKEEFNNSYDELLELNNKIVETYNNFEIKNSQLQVVEYKIDDIVDEEKKELFDIKKIKQEFDKTIIGQDDAKKAIIKAIFKNRVRDNIESSNKNNCLLIGPTGCGKTLIAEVAAKYFNLPLDIVDSPQITAAGYVGANITDCLEHLLSQTKGNLKEAERGIIVFDELDKKGQSGSGANSDVNKGDVLNEMLKFIEGSKYDVTYNNKNYVFDTSNLSIIGMGSFAAAQEDMNQNEIGFNKNQNDIEEDIKYKKMTTDDFSKKAYIPPELVGRFTIKKQLSGHTIETLRRILTESKSSALLSEKDILNCLDIELSWTDSFLDEVAKKAVKLKTGARSLKSTIEEAIEEAEWEVMSNLDIYKGIILTDKSVNDNLNVILVDKQNNKHILKDIIDAKDKTSLSVQKKLVYNKGL